MSTTKAINANQLGFVIAVNGLVVTVRLSGRQPAVGEMLTINEKPGVVLFVESVNDTEAECLNIRGSNSICRGDKISGQGISLGLPAGKPVLGRVFNALGEVMDGQATLKKTDLVPYNAPIQQKLRKLHKPEVLETGIKVIDFLAPFVKGRRIGIIGGAGVGKTVLTTEMIHNVADKKTALNFFVGIGERIREGHELFHALQKRGLVDNTVMYMGQMNDNAALRSMVGPSAATVARSFSDEGKDILFFIDNIFRFVQARNELAAMRGGIPSEGGYQASMFSDLHCFEDSLVSSGKGSITSIQSIYIPADDLGDPAVVEISQQLDSTIVLSRDIFERGVFPAVDLLATTSTLITPEVLGERHYRLVGRVKAIMRKYYNLRTITAIVGENELSPEDRADFLHAQEITKFFSQDMFVTEDLTGKKGQYFTREQTLKGLEAILQ